MRAKKKASLNFCTVIFFSRLLSSLRDHLFIKLNCRWTVSGVQTVKGGGRDPY